MMWVVVSNNDQGRKSESMFRVPFVVWTLEYTTKSVVISRFLVDFKRHFQTMTTIMSISYIPGTLLFGRHFFPTERESHLERE